MAAQDLKSFSQQWRGRVVDHGTVCFASLPGSFYWSDVADGKGPSKNSWMPPSWPPSSALLGEPSSDGQKWPAQIHPEGEICFQFSMCSYCWLNPTEDIVKGWKEQRPLILPNLFESQDALSVGACRKVRRRVWVWILYLLSHPVLGAWN